MIKKLYIISIVLWMISCFFDVSSAYDIGTVYLKYSEEAIKKDEEVEVVIAIENSKIAAYTSYLFFDDSKLEYVSGPEYTNLIENKVICVWYDETGGNSLKSGELVRFKFRAKEEGIANFGIEGEFYDSEGKLVQTKFENSSIVISNIVQADLQSQNDIQVVEDKMTNTIQLNENSSQLLEYDYEEETNTNLEILAIENILLNPDFEADITHYEIEISNTMTKLNILAVPENEESKVEIKGNENLKEGENFIQIIVTDKNNLSQKVYEILTIKRTAKQEDNYEQEQENNKQKLEKVYETEKLSEENIQLQETKEQNNGSIKKSSKSKMIIWLLAMLVMTSIGIYFIKNSNYLK